MELDGSDVGLNHHLLWILKLSWLCLVTSGLDPGTFLFKKMYSRFNGGQMWCHFLNLWKKIFFLLCHSLWGSPCLSAVSDQCVSVWGRTKRGRRKFEAPVADCICRLASHLFIFVVVFNGRINVMADMRFEIMPYHHHHHNSAVGLAACLRMLHVDWNTSLVDLL